MTQTIYENVQPMTHLFTNIFLKCNSNYKKTTGIHITNEIE